jgi:hypothetical protein
MKEIPERLKKESQTLLGKAADTAVTQFSHWKNRKEFQKLRTSDGEYTLERI